MAIVKPTNSIHGAIVVSKWEMLQGDTIPLHDHTTRPLSQHVTIVAKGLVEIRFPNTGESLGFIAGDFFDYTPEQQSHEIVALEDSILFNIAKAVVP